MPGKILNYYAGGNTARGFHNLFSSNLQGLQRLFILKGGPGTGKSTLMKELGKRWAELGYDLEYIHCGSDNGSIDGVIIPALQVGIVDGTAPHVIEPEAPGAIEEYVNLGEAWDHSKLAPRTADIQRISASIRECYQQAYETFAAALRIHDEWEKPYIANLDFTKANVLTAELIESLFAGRKGTGEGLAKHRFLGAATPKGPVDFIQNLTEELPHRYFLKGRPGSGKSTLLKKLAAHAEQNGFAVEVYHCGFDPNSLDMVIVRELGWAIFDSTAPHEHFPDRDGDRVIDMYERIITPGTDEVYADEIAAISKRYKEAMNVATGHLAQAKALHDELEAIYIDSMDYSIVDDLRERIHEQIALRAKAKQPVQED
ncbi:PRK06851 family protein [Brevibacillus migulae]|uniref:PRK06851 family protein n=1 Tax=Brevibacillus migulae TaxID=1644114 RepID=UPI00106E6920|nr:PRK06851 family protein [Brevibacillus migulae]